MSFFPPEPLAAGCVRGRLADVSKDLKWLRGKSAFLNYAGRGTNHLSRLLLARVGLSVVTDAGKPANDGVFLSPTSSRDISTLLDSMRKADKDAKKVMQAKLPDVCFLIASLPSKLAWRLINEADYRLVPLIWLPRDSRPTSPCRRTKRNESSISTSG